VEVLKCEANRFAVSFIILLFELFVVSACMKYLRWLNC
jgi:hypothetical protein